MTDEAKPAKKKIARKREQKFRSRIVGNAVHWIESSALRANPKNWRRHPKAQKDALSALLDSVGFAGCGLAYVPDADKGAWPDPTAPGAPLMLIDGHLRQELDAKTPVLILDVSDEEAEKLLLTVDPIAALAEADARAVEHLRQQVDLEDELLCVVEDLDVSAIVESGGTSAFDSIHFQVPEKAGPFLPERVVKTPEAPEVPTTPTVHVPPSDNPFDAMFDSPPAPSSPPSPEPDRRSAAEALGLAPTAPKPLCRCPSCGNEFPLPT